MSGKHFDTTTCLAVAKSWTPYKPVFPIANIIMTLEGSGCFYNRVNNHCLQEILPIFVFSLSYIRFKTTLLKQLMDHA